MSEGQTISVHRFLQYYVAVLATCITLIVSLATYQVKEWHSQFVQTQGDVHLIKESLVNVTANAGFHEKRISQCEADIKSIRGIQ